jgi:hypothetical protein
MTRLGLQRDKNDKDIHNNTKGRALKSPSLQCHHMSLMVFVISSPGCGRRLTDLWGWDVHEAQLRCPDVVDGDI